MSANKRETRALVLKIRPLRATDLEAVMQLHQELGWNPAFKADGTTLRQRLERLVAGDTALLVVAELNRLVVAYAHADVLTHLLFAGREMQITEIFVREKARGRGVGKALMSALEAEAVKRRCFRITVLNSRERESYHRGFYPSLGYEERAQTATFTKRLDWGDGP